MNTVDLLKTASVEFRLIKTCLDGTQCKVRIGNYLSSSFPIENSLKEGDALLPLLFNFAQEYAIRKLQETNLGLDMNGIHLVLTYTENVNLIINYIRITERNVNYY